MSSSSSPLSPLERLAEIATLHLGDDCEEANFEKYQKELEDPEKRTWDSMWLFQTCNEFGFYQTCPSSGNCLWIKESLQNLDDLEFNMLPCRHSFGIEREEVEKNIQKTNSFYGGLRPDLNGASKIVYPNGGVDPWHAASIVMPPSWELPTVWVPSASHHAWTHIPKGGDKEDVKQARVSISNFVRKWVEEARGKVRQPEDIMEFV